MCLVYAQLLCLGSKQLYAAVIRRTYTGDQLAPQISPG
jgi:hypothetical protein